MTVPAATFTNPSTGMAYRLVISGDGGWRITKSRDEGGQVQLFHLRGRVGDDPVDADAVAKLVAGTGGVAARAMDPVALFASVVLRDLACTADVLTAIARRGHEVYEDGCPGFRPRSPVLRRQRDEAMARAAAEMQSMAHAWKASGFEAGPVPQWLTAALVDGVAAAVSQGQGLSGAMSV